MASTRCTAHGRSICNHLHIFGTCLIYLSLRLIASITNEPRRVGRYAGLLRATMAAGTAIFFGVAAGGATLQYDGRPVLAKLLTSIGINSLLSSWFSSQPFSLSFTLSTITLPLLTMRKRRQLYSFRNKKQRSCISKWILVLIM